MPRQVDYSPPRLVNKETLVAELKALNIPGVRTYSVLGPGDMCTGVYSWAEFQEDGITKQPAGEYHHIDVTEAQANQIRDAISAHRYVAPPDPDDELIAAINAATDLAELKAALVGQVRKGRIKARLV